MRKPMHKISTRTLFLLLLASSAVHSMEKTAGTAEIERPYVEGQSVSLLDLPNDLLTKIAAACGDDRENLRKTCELMSSIASIENSALFQLIVISEASAMQQLINYCMKNSKYNSNIIHNLLKWVGPDAIYNQLADEKHEPIMEVLIKNDLDLNVTDSALFTALHKAAFFGKANKIEFLLNHGADPFIKNIYGKVPLESALANEHHGVVKLLITHVAPR